MRPAAESATTQGDGRFDQRRWVWILITVSGAAFLDFLDITVVNLAFPDMQADFGEAAVGDLAWVIAGYAVTLAAVLTPAGRLADVTGRRTMFLAGTVTFALASLLSALAPSLEVLIAARLLQGAGAAMTLPAGLGIALAASPPERRAAAIGAWSAAAAVAAIVGPALGGVLVDVFGWRAVFLINVPIGALIVYGAARLVEESPRTSEPLPDLVGILLFASGIGLVVLSLSQAPIWGWTDARTVGCAVGGAFTTFVALLRAGKHPSPVIEADLWRIPSFAVANATSALMGLVVGAWLLNCVLFLTGVWGYTELEAGLAMSPGAVTGAVSAALVGSRLGADNQRAVTGGSMLLLAAVGGWLIVQLDTDPQFVAVWLPAALAAGAAMGAMGVAISTGAATAVAADRYAAATGQNLTTRQVGTALGVAALAAILQAGLPERGIDAYLDVFLLCSATAGCGALVALALRVVPRPAGAGHSPADG